MIKIKKGDITTQQIVLLIILIASFVVILFFILRLNLGGMTESEVCHNSVIVRSSGLLAQKIFPLNCKTNYVCLSKDGTCESMTSPEVVKVKTKEEVYKALAEKGVDCWWMFGEGKADYIGGAELHPYGYASDLYCSICSQIAFDDSIKEIFPKTILRFEGIAGQSSDVPISLISREDFYKYLASTKISGKDISYLEYFLGLQNSEIISEALKSKNYSWGYIDLGKRYLIMMGEFSKVEPFQNVLEGVIKGVLFFVVLPIPIVGGPLGIALIVSTVYNPFTQRNAYMIGTVIQGESGHAYLSPTIIEANSEDYEALKCADIKTLA